jgi:hypothetical protein
MLFLLATGLVACAGGPGTSPLPRYPGDMPPDARAAAGALVAGLHAKPTPRVAFGRDTALPVLDREFTPVGHRFVGYRSNAADGQSRLAIGLLDFAHADGRLLPLLYGLDYTARPTELALTRARVAIWATPQPRLEVFVVPKASLAQGKIEGASYGALRQAVKERAMRPTAAAGKTDDYVMFVFVRDPVSPTARFDIRVANEITGNGGYPLPASEAVFDGWRVIAAAGRFALGGPGTPLVLKVVYTPGDEADFLDRYPRPAGAYLLSGTRR